MYYQNTGIFTFLEPKQVIVLADPQLLKVQGIDVVKFNRALFEILHKSTPIGHYLWHDYLLNNIEIIHKFY